MECRAFSLNTNLFESASAFNIFAFTPPTRCALVRGVHTPARSSLPSSRLKLLLCPLFFAFLETWKGTGVSSNDSLHRFGLGVATRKRRRSTVCRNACWESESAFVIMPRAHGINGMGWMSWWSAMLYAVLEWNAALFHVRVKQNRFGFLSLMVDGKAW